MKEVIATKLLVHSMPFATKDLASVFLMVISYSIFIANRDGKPLDSVIFWSSFIGYMGSMIAIVIMLQLRFRLPK